MSTLALFGGAPVRSALFPAHLTMGAEERAAVDAVMASGVLSQFIGAHHDNFLGGPRVRAFEALWAEMCAAKHAIAVNSCTSGLYAAVGAAGVDPGDEVIVSPYTMAASATAAVAFAAVPVFADIDPATYCITADTIAERLTDRTRAIVVPHIFGQPADMDPIMALAEQHGLIVIEDAAQAPMARYKGRPVGALGHIGVFSFNYHKHIHTGEGGVVTTNDDDLAARIQLIRNHAEAAVGARRPEDLVNMIGQNYRMGEIEAAIGLEQAKKLEELLARRKRNVLRLEARLSVLPGFTPAPSAGDHVYYVHPIDYERAETGVSRSLVLAALRAELPAAELREKEGPLIGAGYVRPLYLLPMYQKLKAFGSGGFPFVGGDRMAPPDYAPGLCPAAEDAHENRLIHHEIMYPGLSDADMDDVADAFEKVAEHMGALRDAEQRAPAA